MRNLGNAQDAMDYALSDEVEDTVDKIVFLRNWSAGDLSNWPNYLIWLDARYAA